MMKVLRSVLLLSLVQASTGQFTCSLAGATDSNSCTAETDDSSDHCVWCSVGSQQDRLTEFGFCVSESQAEAMEESLPMVHCDRYSGDDDTTNDDDETDDKTDDDATTDDDVVPDNYWKCLKASSAKECSTEDKCTWCDTKGGFGLCLSGPSAEAAEESDWFTCKAGQEQSSNVDPSCAAAFVKDPTRNGCTHAVDEDGNACEFCTILNGLSAVCLTADQADEAPAQLGVSCDALAGVSDPYDPSCVLAYLQDSTKEGCVSSTDADGNPCEFCTLQGALEVCLSEEQAEMGEQFGIDCGEAVHEATVKDPYDPTCMLEYLQDPSEEGCVNTVDADGNPCEFCTLQGALEVCLSEEQAEMGEQFGIDCGEAVHEATVKDPYDPTCMLEYLQDPSEEGCVNTVDADGNPCEFCTLQGALEVCLSEEQAEMGEQFGIDCGEAVHEATVKDPYDPTCMLEYLQDPSKEGCVNTVDADGNPCEFCTLQGALEVCLTEEQAEMGEQFGIDCDETIDDEVALPDDFFECLQEFQEGDCRASSCTWCNTQVGMGFCLSTPAAEATKECTFFDCELQENPVEAGATNMMDPLCLAAAMDSDDKETACQGASDMDGNDCVWCDAAGVFGLCLSSDQANAAGEYLLCNQEAAAMA